MTGVFLWSLCLSNFSHPNVVLWHTSRTEVLSCSYQSSSLVYNSVLILLVRVYFLLPLADSPLYKLPELPRTPNLGFSVTGNSSHTMSHSYWTVLFTVQFISQSQPLVKNSGRSDTFPILQPTRLPCLSFMDAGKGRRISSWRQRSLLLNS